MTDEQEKPGMKVVVTRGPYKVIGGVPLVRKTQVVSEHGEPIAWQKEGEIDTGGEGEYLLCRCGQSAHKPFCDRTHREIDFDGTETADTDATAERAMRIPGGTGIIVKKDASLCMLSGFCGLRNAGLNQLVAGTQDTQLRALVIGMIEKCPSGALTYQLVEDGAEIEPDLPRQIAVTTEITSDGPIPGPLWVSGGIPIERADGQPFETRNRVTLCSCGQSHSKPLCDGTHRLMAERESRRKRFSGE